MSLRSEAGTSKDCKRMGLIKNRAGRNISNEEKGSRNGGRGCKAARNAGIFGPAGP